MKPEAVKSTNSGGDCVGVVMKTSKKLQDVGTLFREDFDGGPVSLDQIVPGLFLGNLTAATNTEILNTLKITHILTLDSVPLPQHIVESSFLTTKFVQISDMPKEDILQHLDQCVDFISAALSKEKNVLVHCYFGVSRSSSVVIAYVMKEHNLDYQPAYELVKYKRRFVQPNTGFVLQLRLYRNMGCRIDPEFQEYKIYRLRSAGEQVRKAKILPQNFNNLINLDPAITLENPEPTVYRCRKCRRVVATRSHVLLHTRKSTSTDGNILNIYGEKSTKTTSRLIDHMAEKICEVSLDSPVDGKQSRAHNAATEAAPEVECKSILFVEPIAWMKQVLNNTQGRLNCPKCEQKLGNFSWINGCQCPCGEEVSPAFYLIPSKVELSKSVQNVQATV